MRSLSSILGALGLVGAAGAQLVDVPSVENFYRRSTASATVIGNYVYIDGGEVSQAANGKSPSNQGYASNQVNSTISIDLSKSWTTSDVVLRTIERPWFSKAGQVIWTDYEAGNFYVWAGKWVRGKNMTDNELWKFTPDGSGGGTWALDPPANPGLFNDLHQAEFVVYANNNDTGFAIGGVATGWTEHYRASNQPLPGMVAFNMKTKTWHNGTTAFSPFDTLAAGAAQYLPGFGPNGLIIVLGGVAHPVVGETDWATARPFDLRNLTFFDPVTKEKYWQIATGDIPPSPRALFCIAGFPNSDGGYEILLTGGYNHRDQIPYNDAYVLSLPGFVWTKAPDPPGGARKSHTCVSVGNRQMLSIGGMNALWGDKDPAPQGLQLFDMTDMEWKDSYDANAAAYERTAGLKAWYSNGSFDAVEWSSDQARQLFITETNNPGSSSPSPTDGASSPTDGASSPSVTTDPQSQSAPVAAIAGGVVGGVAGIAIIAVVAWLLIRRRRANHEPDQIHENDDTYEHYAPEAVKARPTGPELQGSKAPVTELTSEREHGELGGSIAYKSPVVNYMAPVEMDATPARRYL